MIDKENFIENDLETNIEKDSNDIKKQIDNFFFIFKK